jgi:Na+/H+ antiporter NhaA
VKATIDGVVRMPSLFSMTLAFLPSMTATQELVVPRSIPMTLLMDTPSSKAGWAGPVKHRPDPLEVTALP